MAGVCFKRSDFVKIRILLKFTYFLRLGVNLVFKHKSKSYECNFTWFARMVCLQVVSILKYPLKKQAKIHSPKSYLLKQCVLDGAYKDHV